MKRITTILAVLALGVSIVASTAGAAITITQAPAGPGYQNLAPYPNGVGGCFGSTDSGPNYSASGRPIRLQFGWGAHTNAQMTQFFQESNGTVDITGTDTFHDSWAYNPNGTPYLTQQGIQWGQLRDVQAIPPGGGTTVDALASDYRGVLSLAPGTYTLTQTYNFRKPVQDGFGSYKKSLTSSCSFTVVA